MTALAKTSDAAVLIKAFNQACTELDLTQAEAGKVLGFNASTLSRNAASGFKPQTKQGELALHFIRLYRSLFAIAGGDVAFMRHWFNSPNQALGASPRQSAQTVLGLISTNQYLDAMRGKI